MREEVGRRRSGSGVWLGAFKCALWTDVAAATVLVLAPFAEKVFSFLSKDEVEKLRQEEERKIATLRRDKKSRLLDAANDNIDKDAARHADSTSRQQQQDSNADKNSNSSEEDDDEDDDEEEEDDEDKQRRKDVVDNAVRAQFEDAEDIR